jgi:lipopolysaccharide export system permease protein
VGDEKKAASQGEARRVFNQSVSDEARGGGSLFPGGEISPVWAFRRARRGLSSRALNTFDRHLLREWLQILGLVLAATCGLLVVQVLYDDFRSLRELGARGWVLWQYLLVTMPSFLSVVLPLALLVSLLYTLGKLHRANELTAMRAAGVGFLRLTAPVWVVGVLCCGISWWLNTEIVPWSVERSRALKDTLQFRRDSSQALAPDRIGATDSVAFDNARAGRMWFFNRYSRFTQRGYGVSVSELDARRRETMRLVAAQAWRTAQATGWVFRDGRELTFNVETGELIGSQPFREKILERYDEDPSLMLLIDRRPVDLSLHELSEIIAYHEGEHDVKAVPYAVRFFGLIANTFGPLIVIAIAIPFAVTGVRVNPAVGVSKSIGLFFLYYLLANIAASLATKQLVDPVMAAWLPNLGMLLLALWLFVRLR